MKYATVYERGNTWYFEPSSQATTGLWIAAPPLLPIDRNASARAKYEAGMQVLSASRQGIPLPPDEEDVCAPLLKLANARSWAAFMINTRAIDLKLEGEQLTITPYKKLHRPRGGLEPISEQAIDLPADASPEQIGAAMEEAMALFQ